jgi:hypothetical protein
MDKRILGEFMGTMVLVLMGNGVVAGVLLRKSKAEASGWMVIATGWALAVMCGIFTAVACGSADANLNPAVTLASAIGSGDFSKLLPYSLAPPWFGFTIFRIGARLPMRKPSAPVSAPLPLSGNRPRTWRARSSGRSSSSWSPAPSHPKWALPPAPRPD